LIGPFDLASRYVVPALKRRLAEILVGELGLGAAEAARAVGASPSAVTRYLKAERGALLDVASLPDVDAMLRELARKVAEGSLRKREALTELSKVAAYAMAKGYACPAHLKLEGSSVRGCSACAEVFGWSKRAARA